MFSGTVVDKTTGITVGHALNAEEAVMTFRPQNGEEVREVIGQCLQTFRDVQARTERSEFTITADMAVLDLQPDFWLRKNLVQWAEREFRVKIYKGPSISVNTEVMVLDQMGRFQTGIIRREPFTDTYLETRGMGNLYNVLGIGTAAGTHESAITRPGDSGALVLSLPSERSGDSEDDVLYVYGIVISLYSWSENYLTIANHLGKVIPNVFSSENVVQRVHNIPTDEIDFTEVMDDGPDAQH